MAETTSAPWRIAANTKEQRSFDVLDGEQDSVDISTWTVDARIRDRPGGTVLWTFPAEFVAVNAPGEVVLTIPAPVSAGWAWTTGWYRIRCYDPASDEDNPDASRVLSGPVVIDPD